MRREKSILSPITLHIKGSILLLSKKLTPLVQGPPGVSYEQLGGPPLSPQWSLLCTLSFLVLELNQPREDSQLSNSKKSYGRLIKGPILLLKLLSLFLRLKG